MTLKNGFSKCTLFVLTVNGWKIKAGPLHFPPKKTLIWRGHCLIGQSCCSVTSQQSIGWFPASSRAWRFFSAECSLNQPKATCICIYSINQSIRSISILLLFLYCSRIFISRSYVNRSNRPLHGCFQNFD